MTPESCRNGSPVPPLIALWELFVLKTLDFGMIVGPLWLLWAVSGFIHLGKAAKRDSIGKPNRKPRF